MRWLVLALVALLACPGCAFLDRDNLVLFDAFERNLVPDLDTRPGLHAAVAPLTYPAGLLLLLLDTVVTHPILVVDDAWEDTRKVCWDEFEWDDHYVTEVTLLPLRTFGTPLVFLGDFLARAAFDIDPPRHREVEQEEAARKALIEKVRAAHRAGRHREVVTLVAGREKRFTRDEDWRAVELLALTSAVALEDAAAVAAQLQHTGNLRGLDAAQAARLAAFLPRLDPEARLRLGRRIGWIDPQARDPLAAALLADPDPVIRYFTLRSAAGRVHIPPALLERLGRDGSPTIRRLAEQHQPPKKAR